MIRITTKEGLTKINHNKVKHVRCINDKVKFGISLDRTVFGIERYMVIVFVTHGKVFKFPDLTPEQRDEILDKFDRKEQYIKERYDLRQG